MALETSELVAALPEELEGEFGSSSSALADVLAKLSHRPVPVGRLTRLWTLGTMEAKVAAGYLAYWIRSGFKSANEKERQLNETHLKAALQLLGGMGYMRGMIAKVGQVLGHASNILPEDFVAVLSKLHFEAPAMHYSLVREHLRNELGGDAEEVFSEFETRAFAAASLGQVHRARTKQGELVAVKVQYPNIGKTICSDFKNLMMIMAPMRLNKDWDNIRGQWDDVRQMLEWETDYVREASFLKRARGAFEGDAGIVVPAVHEAYSTSRVLTMDLLEGVHLEEYLAGKPSQEERDSYGERIMRGSFGVLHKAKLWYADSNPGNYVFMKDGRLGLIDFGCCRDFSEAEWDYYKEVARSHRKGPAALRRAMCRAVDLDPDAPQDEDYMRFLGEFAEWYNEYISFDGAFDFSNEAYIERGIELHTRIARKRYFRAVPVNTWINRHLLGLIMMLYRLRARVNVRRVAEESCAGLYT